MLVYEIFVMSMLTLTLLKLPDAKCQTAFKNKTLGNKMMMYGLKLFVCVIALDVLMQQK